MKLQDMINELIDKHGLTEQAIADEIRAHGSKANQSQIHKIKHGFTRDPLYTTGKAIEAVYYRYNQRAA